MTPAIRRHDGLGDIAAADWNALAGHGDPFVRHEYLHALETTGAVGAGSGWTPRHLGAWRGDELVAALPLYERTDSWGEFVFDFAWADAYTRHGRQYYPKLLTAVPYTPVTGPRILQREEAGPEAADALIRAALGATEEEGFSSWHVLFCNDRDRAQLERAGLLLRKDCQFHWHSRGDRDFDGYLSHFRASRRKKTRRERRKVSESGLTFQWHHGSELDARQWHRFYRFYASSFILRGRAPYFSEDLFTTLGASLGERIRVVFALRGEEPVAAALFFVGGDTLYGRYWGSSEYHDALHFETCYYQGIDYCLANGIRRFDPGTQGEHKIARGFQATASWSAHFIADPDFRRAIDDYLRREREHVDLYMSEVDRHLPFRREDALP